MHFFVQAACSSTDVTLKTSLIFKTSNFGLNTGDYFQKSSGSGCSFQSCTCNPTSCSVLTYSFNSNGNLDATNSNENSFNS